MEGSKVNIKCKFHGTEKGGHEKKKTLYENIIKILSPLN
jgi:hypothetical protein